MRTMGGQPAHPLYVLARRGEASEARPITTNLTYGTSDSEANATTMIRSRRQEHRKPAQHSFAAQQNQTTPIRRRRRSTGNQRSTRLTAYASVSWSLARCALVACAVRGVHGESAGLGRTSLGERLAGFWGSLERFGPSSLAPPPPRTPPSHGRDLDV